MDQVLIVGVDSIVGRSVAQSLVGRSEVCGLWLDRPEFSNDCRFARMDEAMLDENCQDADVVIFCGGASASSWDAEFGDFHQEERWLDLCIRCAERTDTRFVFVSSDAVFGGPWVFHNDDCDSWSDSSAAVALRNFESRVAALENSLVVLTHVAGVDDGGSSFAARIIRCIQAGDCEHVDAAVYATPVGADDFGSILADCLAAGTEGYINIGGAERTTAYRFATALAAGLDCTAEHLVPATRKGRTREQSLRCERLRHELKIPVPMLKETAEQIAAAATERQKQSAAA